LFGQFLALEEVFHQSGLFGELFPGDWSLLCNYRRWFDLSFLGGIFFKFKNCFDCYLHKILEAVSNELSVIDYLEEIANEDLLSSDVLVLAGVGEAGVVLVAAGEHCANRSCERNRQHQIVGAHQDGVREDAINLGLTRLILRLVYEFDWRGFLTCL